MPSISRRFRLAITAFFSGRYPAQSRVSIPAISPQEIDEVRQFFPLDKFFIFGHARSGTTLGASPPSRVTQWVRCVIGVCSRILSVAACISSTASVALLPIHGFDPEWAVLPLKVTTKEYIPAPDVPYEVPNAPELWQSSTTSTSSNRPARIM